MLFSTLMNKYLDEDIKPDVEQLLDLKRNMPEIGAGKRLDRINNYLERNIEEIGKVIRDLPNEDTHNWEELNKIFLSLIE